MTVPTPARYVELSRAAPRAVRLRWWQPGKLAPLDCTSFSCTTLKTQLPYTPQFEALDLPQGTFRMMPPPTDRILS